MSTNMRAAILALKPLTLSELEELEKRIRALRFGAPGAMSETDDHVSGGDLIIQTICDTLNGLGVDRTQAPTLKRSKYYPAMKAKAPDILSFIRGQAGTRNQQRALLALGINLLYENMTKVGLPVSAMLLMGHIHRLPSIFNQNFPGYARSGFLGMLVKGDTDVREE
jgi:hypothetical protein